MTAEGRWLVPGLWDMHVHLTDATQLAMPVLLANGVTGVRDAGGDVDVVSDMERRSGIGQLDGPRIFMAGPYVDGPEEGSPHRITVESAREGRSAADSVRALGADFVKVHNGVPPDAYFALIERAHEIGLPVVAHVPVDVSPVAAARPGQAGLTPREALATATTRPATFPRADSPGAVVVGRRADMVLLSQDPRADIRHTREIEAVFADGRCYGRQELDALLERAAATAEEH